MKRLLYILPLLLIFACVSRHESSGEIDIPCVEPTRTTVQTMELMELIAPSSPSRIAQDLLNPKANLNRYGFRYRTKVEVQNVSGGIIYLDSLHLNVARSDGKDEFNSSALLDQSIYLADSAQTTVSTLSTVRADEIDGDFLRDLLEQNIRKLKATPTLFVRFSDNHVCKEALEAGDGLLTTTGTMVFETTTDIVVWIIENPKDFAEIILLILSILLKAGG